jgi:hypothetical protein
MIKGRIATGALLLAVGAFGSACSSGSSQQSQAMKRACADLRRMGGIKVSPVPEGSPDTAGSFQTVTIWNPQDLKNSGNAVLARLPSQIQRDSGSLSRTEAVLRVAAAQCRVS